VPVAPQAAADPLPVIHPLPEAGVDEVLAVQPVRPAPLAPRLGPPLPDYPHLGGVRAELRGKGSWAGVAVLLALVPVFLLIAAINADRRKPAVVALFLGLSVVTVLLAVLPAVESIRRMGRRVWVCQNGLAWRAGRKRGSLSWPEIATVTYQHHVPQLVMMFGLLGALAARFLGCGRLTLTTRAGDTVELPAGVWGLYLAATIVSEGIKPHTLPALEQAVAAGQPTEFGPHISLEGPGIKWVDQKIRWENLNGLEIRYRAAAPSVLHAHAGRPLLDIELGAIPNLHLMLELVERRFHVPVRTVGGASLP
jgi:hypothetical protein